MIYTLEDKKFTLSYSELKEKYINFTQMSDTDFLRNLPGAAHLACVICFLKEIPAEHCISDTGIIHEVIHLMHGEPVGSLDEIREQFKNQLKLD